MLIPFREPGLFNVTLNTTEDCNLRCTYCYEVHKRRRKLSMDDAKAFIDHILTDPDPAGLLDDPDPVFRKAYQKGLVVDFIGGDSFMDVPFLDEICSYTLAKVMTTDTPNARNWRGKLHFSISTNGTLFSEQARRFCEKYKDLLLVGISLDGCPEIHDVNRVFPDGSGSMQSIIRHWPWYKKTFPIQSMQTKSTANRQSIPHLYDSLVYLHEQLGLRYINQNFIMEDTGCTQADYEELDRQMEKCTAYVLEHRDDLFWSMLSKEQFGYAHLSTGPDWDCTGHCGSGAMPALSVDGRIYPCIRWLPHTQIDKADFIVGTAKEGFTHKENFLRVREGAYRASCSLDEKYRKCEVESACSYCIGGCYSEFGEFKRTTYICEITKLMVKWARRYWDEYNRLEGLDPIDWAVEAKEKGNRHGIG